MSLTVLEGENYPLGYLRIGKVKNDGFYLKMRMPFTRFKNVINPNTFEKEYLPCRYNIFVRVRWPLKRSFVINCWSHSS